MRHSNVPTLWIILVAFCVLGIGSSLCFGASATYLIQGDGSQQVPGPGDADGWVTGTITLDDVTGVISWDFTYRNIDAPTLMHIHGPNGSAGQTAGVHIGLGVVTSGGPGTLVNSMVHAVLQDVTDVLDDPTDFYVNIHNPAFGAGAVRGQLGTGGFSGVVPDGTTGLPLLLGKAAGGTVDLDWVPSCLHTDTDYEIYEGDIGVFYSHGLFACTTGGLTFANIAPGAGSHYYLVVPTDGVIEGSYGTDSNGAERPPGVAVCLAQSIACP